MIQEVLESERADIKTLRTLRERAKDMESLNLIADMLEEKAERVIKLTELYHYKDAPESVPVQSVPPFPAIGAGNGGENGGS